VSTTQLRAFHFVALAGGFSRAARELGIGQSTLSAQVRQLEAGSGVNFLERKPRGVGLTDEGRALFEVTSRLFAAEAEARSLLRGEGLRIGGHLRIAADGAFHPVPIMAAMKAARPQLTFALSIGNSEQVIDQLIGYRADVGITARLPTDPRLLVHPMLTMALGVFVPAGHAWAHRSRVVMAELAGVQFVLRERGSVTRYVFEQNVAEHHVTLGSIIEVSTREGVREMVAAGFGVGIVADREFGHDSRLRFLPIADARKRISEYAICLEERRRMPLVREFLARAAEAPQAAA
jgi:aminoethylphosphonate catabolism LysR family transcriptional regulator